MKQADALNALRELDRRGIYVLSKGDLGKLFPDEEDKTLEKSLQRLVADSILDRVSKGVYLNPVATSKKSHVVEDIAVVLRRGHFSYVSLESILSEYGAISQIPVRRLTVMTTGAKGVYDTPYGSIEFTHTKRRPADIISRTLSVKNRPLRIASRQAAERDLRRAGRNTDLIVKMEIA
jgi:hypothetical protein